MDKNIIYENVTPNGLWRLQILAPNQNRPYCAVFQRNNNSGVTYMGFPFGFETDTSNLFVDWNLPDNSCGIYLKGKCYAIFRYGAYRRHNREAYHVGENNYFTQEDINGFCAKKRKQKSG